MATEQAQLVPGKLALSWPRRCSQINLGTGEYLRPEQEWNLQIVAGCILNVPSKKILFDVTAEYRQDHLKRFRNPVHTLMGMAVTQFANDLERRENLEIFSRVLIHPAVSEDDLKNVHDADECMVDQEADVLLKPHLVADLMRQQALADRCNEAIQHCKNKLTADFQSEYFSEYFTNHYNTIFGFLRSCVEAASSYIMKKGELQEHLPTVERSARELLKRQRRNDRYEHELKMGRGYVHRLGDIDSWESHPPDPTRVLEALKEMGYRI